MLDFGYYNMDCMDGMKEFPDKYFDLAIADPPYFSGPEKRNYYGRTVSPIGAKRYYKPSAEWRVPDKSYFDELIRVSKHQIIWGCNYFNYQGWHPTLSDPDSGGEPNIVDGFQKL